MVKPTYTMVKMMIYGDEEMVELSLLRYAHFDCYAHCGDYDDDCGSTDHKLWKEMWSKMDS